jgi:hypothetical protein
MLGLAASAQTSFSITNQSPGLYITAEVEIAPQFQQVIEFHADITNIGTSFVTLRALRETLSQATSHTNNFCIGPICYPAFVDTSVLEDSVHMEPGHIESTFIGHVKPNEAPGITYVKYCMFDHNDPSDSTCFNVVYDVTPVGIRESSNIAVQLGDVYPNPTSSSASFAYMIEGTPAKKELVIYDMIGNLVSEESLLSFQGMHNISTKQLNSGVYMMSIRLDGVIGGTKRLIVEH